MLYLCYLVTRAYNIPDCNEIVGVTVCKAWFFSISATQLFDTLSYPFAQRPVLRPDVRPSVAYQATSAGNSGGLEALEQRTLSSLMWERVSVTRKYCQQQGGCGARLMPHG